jgi:hypothetical protein
MIPPFQLHVEWQIGSKGFALRYCLAAFQACPPDPPDVSGVRRLTELSSHHMSDFDLRLSNCQVVLVPKFAKNNSW